MNSQLKLQNFSQMYIFKLSYLTNSTTDGLRFLYKIAKSCNILDYINEWDEFPYSIEINIYESRSLKLEQIIRYSPDNKFVSVLNLLEINFFKEVYNLSRIVRNFLLYFLFRAAFRNIDANYFVFIEKGNVYEKWYKISIIMYRTFRMIIAV